MGWAWAHPHRPPGRTQPPLLLRSPAAPQDGERGPQDGGGQPGAGWQPHRELRLLSPGAAAPRALCGAVRGAPEPGGRLRSAGRGSITCGPAAAPDRPPACPSQKAAEEQPSKRLKTEELGLVEPEQGLPFGHAALSVFVQTPLTDEEQCSEDSGDHAVIHQQKGGSIPETSREEEGKEHNVSHKPGKDVHACVCSEENSSESAASDGSGSEDADLPAKVMRLDSSVFVDEDSNQPMPMDRFFGNVEFLQDLPAVALLSTTMSRREHRKLHFVAKEEEEEEDVV
uniref:Uncharacterized protein n=1 Tax=Melopsittacus undulatus TaxID=13146 RepID=A0A8C6JZB9_MELUD